MNIAKKKISTFIYMNKNLIYNFSEPLLKGVRVLDLSRILAGPVFI
jgi:hypothetical protein